MLECGLDNLAGQVAWFAHAQATDGVTGKADFEGAFGGFFSQFAIHATLDDAEQGLSSAGASARGAFSFRLHVPSISAARNWKLETRNCRPGNFMFVLFKIFLAASGPAGGHFHRRSGAGTIHGKLSTFVKRHDDVGAQSDLSLHRALGAEEMRRAIQVRPKGHTFFVDLAQLVQTENLKSAGVSEDRPAPSHEPMQPAQLSHGLDARPQIEVIGIAK